VDATAQRQFFAAALGTSNMTANCHAQQEKAIRMTAATDRSQLLRAVADAKRAVEENPRPETYRALLEAQSELQRYDLTHGRLDISLANENNAAVGWSAIVTEVDFRREEEPRQLELAQLPSGAETRP
jgi:hypothetical protein